MRLGFFLTNVGQAGNSSAILKIARRAEELRYDSLWVTERLLYALNPQTSYYGGPLPKSYKRVLGLIRTLRFVSGLTPNPQGSERHVFSGSIDQIDEDIQALKGFGSDELVLDVTFSADSQSEEGFMTNLERLHRLV
jgi:hypothetical protein